MITLSVNAISGFQCNNLFCFSDDLDDDNDGLNDEEDSDDDGDGIPDSEDDDHPDHDDDNDEL